MPPFVDHRSIVRTIWGRPDTVLFIFAGAAAEFALNKSVDWLYFTGRLPADPISRLFSTVAYAQKIIFSEGVASVEAVDQITAIHRSVEKSRGQSIPDWAYRDVLYMLIDYSRAAYERLERTMTDREKEDLFDVFQRVGLRMGLSELPTSYPAWTIDRQLHLQRDLQPSAFTTDLFGKYREHLGAWRYKVLVEVQKQLVPAQVRKLLGFSNTSWFGPVLACYRVLRLTRLERVLIPWLLPSKYREQVRELGRR